MAAYDFLPVKLWTGIIGKRTRLASSLAIALLRHPMPQPDNPNAKKILRDCVRNANKLLSVVENAVSALDVLAADDSRAATRLHETRDKCFRIAGGLESRIRDCLRTLATLFKQETGSDAPDSPASLRSEFLEDLADSPGFENTMLDHSCLFDKTT